MQYIRFRGLRLFYGKKKHYAFYVAECIILYTISIIYKRVFLKKKWCRLIPQNPIYHEELSINSI